MKNKNGFTLIELLAVIVILAVVMLIAATAVLPMMTKSRKNALLDEGLALEKAAKLAYQDPVAGKAVGKTACYSLQYLNESGFYEKGAKDGYIGSVLITPINNSKSYKYQFWISNNTYGYNGAYATTSSGGTPATYENAIDAKIAGLNNDKTKYATASTYSFCGTTPASITTASGTIPTTGTTYFYSSFDK